MSDLSSYTPDQINEYLDHINQTYQGQYTPDQMNEYKQAMFKQYAPSDPGNVRSGISKVVQGLDYAGGNVRNAIAQSLEANGLASGITQPGDTDAALHGRAPRTADYLQRAGVPELGKVSDLVPGFSTPEEAKAHRMIPPGLVPEVGGKLDLTGRGTLGAIGDLATDPVTWVSGGLSKLSASLSAIKDPTLLQKLSSYLASTANTAINPIEVVGRNVGTGIYKSGLKALDQIMEKNGKPPLSPRLMEDGVWGTYPSIRSQATRKARELQSSQRAMVDQATEAGATIDPMDALLHSQQMASDLNQRKVTQPAAEWMQDILNDAYDYGPMSPKEARIRKTDLNNTTPPSGYDPHKPNPAVVSGKKVMAGDFDSAVDQAIEDAMPGQGQKYSDDNDYLGQLLSARKTLRSEAAKSQNKNIITSVDGMLGGLGMMGTAGVDAITHSHINPYYAGAIFGIKKATDAAKTTVARTGLGLALDRLSGPEMRLPLGLSTYAVDDLARQGAIDKNENYLKNPWTLFRLKQQQDQEGNDQ